tara:strand:- start:3268 stop:3822 length:555 start_codon:yes stop_codon:yes gene_type:complete
MIIRTAKYNPEYLTQANEIIQSMEEVTPNDGYSYLHGVWDQRLDGWGPLGYVVENGINECLKLFGSRYNRVWHEAWVNIVRPVRRQTGNRHNHVEMNRYLDKPIPTYTWVYYIQMPDNLSGHDGKLEYEDDSGVHRYLPKVGDLIILKGDQWHSIYGSENSSKNRVVVAGNVNISMVKTNNTLM